MKAFSIHDEHDAHHRLEAAARAVDEDTRLHGLPSRENAAALTAAIAALDAIRHPDDGKRGAAKL